MGKVIDLVRTCARCKKVFDHDLECTNGGALHYCEACCWKEIDEYEWPRRQCALCEDEFDYDLKWTDGAAWFCEECAQEMKGLVFKKLE